MLYKWGVWFVLFKTHYPLDVAPQTRKALIAKHGECNVYDDILTVIETRANKITSSLVAAEIAAEGEAASE
jgi:hypothetical protein